SAVTRAALDVLREERLAENAEAMGELFRQRMKELAEKTALITAVRGKGLLNAVVIDDTEDGDTAWNLCLQLMAAGLLAKPTHGNKIRFAPPLVISRGEMEEACGIIGRVALEF
ncbi:MAG: aminotransferase class III-fold pyridoxal phosphate-dependent enzyme, partial [Sphingobacteriaceae bacterium]|nr:aminotransferase class III-fold pyridoxal phosphate-dependent enzyme [Cytophagaceae bacterium]